MAPVVNVELVPDSEALEAAVVSTGMNDIDRRLFTGASNKLDADEMMLSGVADISRSLEGRAAGVSVQNVSSTFGTEDQGAWCHFHSGKFQASMGCGWCHH